MKIMNKGLKRGYLIHESSTGVYSICRILNEYNSMNEAQEDLCKLLVNNIKEKDLLKKYSKK